MSQKRCRSGENDESFPKEPAIWNPPSPQDHYYWCFRNHAKCGPFPIKLYYYNPNERSQQSTTAAVLQSKHDPNSTHLLFKSFSSTMACARRLRLFAIRAAWTVLTPVNPPWIVFEVRLAALTPFLCDFLSFLRATMTGHDDFATRYVENEPKRIFLTEERPLEPRITNVGLI